MNTHAYLLLKAGLFTVLFTVGGEWAEGARLGCKSPSYSDVRDMVEKAAPGDTIVIPAGTAAWTQSLVITKPVVLQGAGVGKTIITNTQGDGDNPNPDEYLTIDIKGSASGWTRISGLEINGARFASGFRVHGGNEIKVIIDNCKFSETRGRGIVCQTIGSVLIFKCEFVDCHKAIDVYGSSADMNNSWNRPLSIGSSKCVVTEDCSFLYRRDGWYPSNAAATSSHGLGGRAVWRFNKWLNEHESLDFYPIIDAHGNQKEVMDGDPSMEPPGGQGGHRGTRQLEVYNNTFINRGGPNSNARLSHYRGGTIYHHNNSYEGSGFHPKFFLQEEDGPSRYSYLNQYPGYDQHRIYFFGNHRNDVEIQAWSSSDPSDNVFIVEGKNLFFERPLEYKELDYPHPWRKTVIGSISVGPKNLKEEE